jgi:hypothetical protein
MNEKCNSCNGFAPFYNPSYTLRLMTNATLSATLVHTYRLRAKGGFPWIGAETR